MNDITYRSREDVDRREPPRDCVLIFKANDNLARMCIFRDEKLTAVHGWGGGLVVLPPEPQPGDTLGTIAGRIARAGYSFSVERLGAVHDTPIISGF